MLDDEIKGFWDKQAREHGVSDLATAPDQAYRQHEIEAIIPHIRGETVLDVGCGNGYSTLAFAKRYPRKAFVGVDYSQAMIDAAIAAKGDQANTDFEVCDARDIHAYPGSWHTIISERCLINLTSWDEQSDALLAMAEKMSAFGRMIIVENFIDGLRNLNELRESFDLPKIKVRWHNRYLYTATFEDFCRNHGLKIKYKTNIGNLYYIVSRVVYARLAANEGVEPQYDNPINYIAAKLPSLGNHNYSPNMLYVLGF